MFKIQSPLSTADSSLQDSGHDQLGLPTFVALQANPHQYAWVRWFGGWIGCAARAFRLEKCNYMGFHTIYCLKHSLFCRLGHKHYVVSKRLN